MEATATALEPTTEIITDAPLVGAETSDEDAAYSAAYDKANADEPAETTEVKPEAKPEAKPETTEEAAEAEAEDVDKIVEAPSELPSGVKKAWKDIPEDARTAIIDSQRDLGRKLADMGRQVQGIIPIRDVLSQAVKELPSLAGMKPEQAATEIFNLAKISNEFNTKPVETMMGLIQKHGMAGQIKAALDGVAPQAGQNTSAMQSKIDALERRLASVSDPNYLREQMSQFSEQSQIETQVSEFAASAEYWGVLEPHIIPIIAETRDEMPDGTPSKDILQASYDKAVEKYLPSLKAKGQASDEDETAPDPQRASAALKAKSVNITSRSSGKHREMTEDEVYSAAYDRAQKRT